MATLGEEVGQMLRAGRERVEPPEHCDTGWRDCGSKLHRVEVPYLAVLWLCASCVMARRRLEPTDDR